MNGGTTWILVPNLFGSERCLYACQATGVVVSVSFAITYII